MNTCWRRREPGRRGEIYAACASCAIATPSAIRASFPQHPAPRLRLQPARAPAGKGFQCRARAGRQRVDLRARAGGDRQAHSLQGLTLAAGARLSRSQPRRRRDSLAPRRAGPWVSKASTTASSRTCAARDCILIDLELLPPGKAWLLVEFDGDDEAAAGRRADEVMQRLRGQGRGAVHAPSRGPRRTAYLGGARIRARRDGAHRCRCTELARLGRLRRPTRAARRLSARSARAARRIPL